MLGSSRISLFCVVAIRYDVPAIEDSNHQVSLEPEDNF